MNVLGKLRGLFNFLIQRSLVLLWRGLQEGDRLKTKTQPTPSHQSTIFLGGELSSLNFSDRHNPKAPPRHSGPTWTSLVVTSSRSLQDSYQNMSYNEHANRRREGSVKEISSSAYCFSFHCTVTGWGLVRDRLVLEEVGWMILTFNQEGHGNISDLKVNNFSRSQYLFFYQNCTVTPHSKWTMRGYL